MTITLNPIQYYTEDDAYHYDTDNRPLRNLEQNDTVLKNAIDQITSNTTILTTAGNWASLAITFDLQGDKGKPFAYRIKVWSTKDQTLLTTQSSNLSEDIIFGYNDIAGAVTILQTTNILNQSFGTGTLVKTFTGSGNNLIINFSGYTGTFGYVVAKAERFGI